MQSNGSLSFFEMEQKFGGAAAYYCLAEIEKVAGIKSWAVAHIDPQTRLANALRMQDALCAPLAQAA